MAKKNNDTALAVTTDTSELVSSLTNDQLADRLKRGKMVARVLVLEEGKCFEGLLHGPGTPRESRDEDAAGEVRVSLLSTWRMTHDSGILVDLMSSYQLDVDLPPLIGHRVFIQKEAKKSVGKKMINQFSIIDMGEDEAEMKKIAIAAAEKKKREEEAAAAVATAPTAA